MRKYFIRTLSVLILSIIGQFVSAQISGIVQESNGEPAVNFKIEVKDTENVAYTDENGNFELPGVKEGEPLTIINRDCVVVAEISAISKMLYRISESLESIVILGFGKTKDAKETVGTATVVKGEDIKGYPIASFDEALAGRVSGLAVSTITGQPGGLPQLRLRGVSSVNGNNSPIYIVDGVRISSGGITSNRNTLDRDMSINMLATINPNDIESYTVLKDAAAAALYGADAGSGVIVIITKQGRQGKARFTVDMQKGFSESTLKGPESIKPATWNKVLIESVKNYRNFQTNQEAIDYINNVYVPQGITPPLWNGSQVSNWSDYIERDKAQQSVVNIGLIGGTDKLTYASSLNYFTQEGIVKTTKFERTMGRLSIGYKATDKLTIKTDISASYSKQNSVLDGSFFSNPIFTKYLMLPTEKVKNPDGSYYLGEDGRMFNKLFNAAYLLDNNYFRTETVKLFSNIQGEYKILEIDNNHNHNNHYSTHNLTYTLNIAPEYINTEEEKYDNPIHGDGANVGGRISNSQTRLFSWNLQNVLNYTVSLGTKSNKEHNFGLRFIQEAYKKDYKYYYTSNTTTGRMGLYSPDLFIKNAGRIGNGYVATRMAYAGNLNYSYNRKYYVDGIIRREAVNNFSKRNRWGTFWSIGAAYIITNEEFVNLKGVDLIKVKTSYGELGNQLLYNDYNSFSLYGYDYNYDDQAGGYIFQLGYEDFTWERIKQFDVGVETQFFNKRLSLSTSYFNKKTKDLIFPKQVSMTTGFNSILVNAGNMVNRGIEVDISGVIIKRKTANDFNWDASVNFTYIQNKITELPLGELVSEINIARKGEAVNSWYLKKWAGVNTQTGEAQWYLNGKGGEVTTNYDEAKRAIQGSPFPKYLLGAETNFSYKGIGLSILLNGSFGHKIYDKFRQYTTSDGQYTNNYGGYEIQDDFWTIDNPNAKNPKPVLYNNSKSNLASTRYLYSGDYIRLRDVKLAYYFSKKITKKIGLNKLEIYLRGTNLWTYTFDKNLRKLGLEPEQNLNGGGTKFTQPTMKTFTIGTSIEF